MNRLWTIALLLLTSLAAASAAQNANQKPAAPATSSKADPTQVLLGDWHGTSICLVKPSACHDEEALYHVKAAPGKPGGLILLADKIVDGKPVFMGPADCAYDAPKRLLRCDFPKGYVELTLQGDRLEGAMFLPDKTRWRDIKLKKIRE